MIVSTPTGVFTLFQSTTPTKLTYNLKETTLKLQEYAVMLAKVTDLTDRVQFHTQDTSYRITHSQSLLPSQVNSQCVSQACMDLKKKEISG